MAFTGRGTTIAPAVQTRQCRGEGAIPAPEYDEWLAALHLQFVHLAARTEASILKRSLAFATVGASFIRSTPGTTTRLFLVAVGALYRSSGLSLRIPALRYSIIAQRRC